jgi:hypothetical protein
MEMKTREFLKASWKFGSYPDSMQANLSTLFQVLLDLRDQNSEILKAVKDKPENIPPRAEAGEKAFEEFRKGIYDIRARGASETKGGI